MKKFLYLILGCVSAAVGAAGTVLPLLPAFPFLLLSAFCFARSSEKLDRWLRSTKLYRDNLSDFAAGRGMTKRVKCRIMITVTLLMSIGFVLMGQKGILSGCIMLVCVWLIHLIYFIFGIRTIPAVKEKDL